MTRPTRFFVAGTDTGVGKTEVTCALLSLLPRPWAYKPCESGGTGDAEALRRAGGGWQALDSICRYQLGAPLAPWLAARREGVHLDFAELLRGFRALGPGPGVVEGAGGLFVPLTAAHDVVDLASALRLPVVLAARAGLGTINHTALSLRELRRRRLPVAAVVLSQTTSGDDEAQPLNRDELQRRFPSVPVVGPVPWTPDAGLRRRRLRAVLRPALR